MITVHESRWEVDGDRARLVADVDVKGEVTPVWFDMPPATARPAWPGDAFASALLKPAMRAGTALRVADPVSLALAESLEGFFQEVYRCWERDLNRVRLDAPRSGERAAVPEGRGVGLFFSGGVDSMFSLVRHRDALTHLVTVHGFDIPLHDEARWRTPLDRLTRVAAGLGKPLLPVRTNLRHVTNPLAKWGLYHGGALAGVGHALGGVVDRMLIGSTHTYSELFPWGSHPLLDPHWGGAGVSFVHDGAGSTRVEKVELIAEHPELLEHLRVCWRNVGEKYNCGACEKCLRTMVNLAVVGALDRCSAFGDARLDLGRVRSMELANENDVSFAQENLDHAREHGADAALIGALAQAIGNAGHVPLFARGKRVARRALLRAVPRGVRQKRRRGRAG